MSKAPAAARAQPEPEEAAAVYVPLDQLHGWDRNPRINDHVVDDVAASITKFGFGNPILARKANGEIIAGHTRMKAALKLGLERVPVRYLDLSEREAHLLALADNKLAERADWAEADLLTLLREFDTEEVELAGWGTDEIEKMAAKILAKDADTDGATEVNPDEYEFAHRCPKCGFEFNDKDKP